MRSGDAPGAGVECDRHDEADSDAEDQESGDDRCGIGGVDVDSGQEGEGRRLDPDAQDQDAARAQTPEEELPGRRSGCDECADHGQEGDSGPQGRVAEVILQVVGQVERSAHLSGPDRGRSDVGGGPCGPGHDPQGQRGGGGGALPDDEQQRQHDRGGEPADGRCRSPGGLLGAVQAEHCAEAGCTAQEQAGQVGECRSVATGVRGGQPAQADEEADRGDRHVDVEGPAPVEPVREGPSDQESGCGSDAARRAEEREDSSATGSFGEGGVEQGECGRAEERCEGALGGAGGHQHGEGGRHARDETRGGEAGLSQPVGPTGAENGRQASAEQDESPIGEGVGGDGPRALGRRQPQILLHAGQGDRDDRHVEDDHELRDQGAGDEEPLPGGRGGGGLRCGLRYSLGCGGAGR